MKSDRLTKRLTATVLTGMLGACNGAAPKPADESAEARATDGMLLAEDFEAYAPGKLPADFEPHETNGFGNVARWGVAVGADGAHCVRVEAANKGQTFNLLLSERSFPKDLECSVRVRADAGQEDQGGGLVWRARDHKNYYITRWNPLEQNLRVYKIVGEVRTQLQSANVAADPKAWHELSASMVGSRIRVSFDGQPLLEVDDATFPEGGYVGLWTKADASTAFDDLRVATPSPR